jgi:hypothetical protein
MLRIAILAVLFLGLPYLNSWDDWGGVLVLLSAYAAVKVALRPEPEASEQGVDL